jgi:3-dehydroquinate synthase
MNIIPWQVGENVIPILIGSDCPAEITDHVASLQADRLFILTDPLVWQLHGPRYEEHFRRLCPTHIIQCHGNESAKTLACVERLSRQLIAEKISRRSLLIAMGGGVIGNLTGLTAALLFRGIRFVHLPTTLLAMHDSVTSLKQGVNCGGTKNILGVYHAPSSIFIDLSFLDSLPQRHIRAGRAELVKNALILGGDYAITVSQQLENPGSRRNLIELGIAAKARLLRDDPHERGPAVVFEYGHTIGHALELACAGELTHGDSVAWGMRCAAWVSQHLGYMNADAQMAHERFIQLLGDLPRPNRSLDIRDVQSRIDRDNKRGHIPVESEGGVPMILLREPGIIIHDPGGLPITHAPRSAVDFALHQLDRNWHSAG